MKRRLTDAARVAHVLDAILEVEKYLKDVAYEDFLLNSEKRYATIKQIESSERLAIEFQQSLRINMLRLRGSRSMVSETSQFMNILEWIT